MRVMVYVGGWWCMCEGGSVGIYVNVEMGKKKKRSTPHEHMDAARTVFNFM